MKSFISRALILTIILGLNIHTANAQFTLSVEYRPRGEFRDGFRQLPPQYGQTPAFLITQRSRLYVGYKSKILNTCFSIQDVRIWGDEPMKKDIACLGVSQAWAEIKACDSFFIKAGRQEFIYDNERLLSNSNFTQKGVAHDALLLKYNIRGFSADLAFAYNQSRDTLNSTDYNTSLGNYKTLSFLWLKYRLKNFCIQTNFIADGYQLKNTQNTVYVRATHGGILSYYSKYVDVHLRGAYQFGQSETGKYINANYANADVITKPIDFISIVAGGEYFTGNDNTNSNTNKIHYFTPLYGSGHKFNGNMEYFTKPSSTNYAGLVDAYLNFIFRIKQKYSLRCDVHSFWLSNKYQMFNVTQNPYLGTEVDLCSKIPLIKYTELQIGYSAMFGSNTLALIQGISRKNFGHWAFVMLTVNPTLFSYDAEKDKK